MTIGEGRASLKVADAAAVANSVQSGETLPRRKDSELQVLVPVASPCSHCQSSPEEEQILVS